MIRILALVFSFSALVGFARPVAATPITIANHSFEATLAATPPTPPRAAVWFTLSTTQFSLPADSSLLASGKAPDGARVLATVSLPSFGTGYVVGIADELLKANTRYTVLVDVGRPLPGYSIPTSFSSIPLTPAGYRIDLGTFPGDVDLASDVNSLVTPSGGFVTAKLTFDIPDGDPRIGEALHIGLGSVSGAEPGAYSALFDNVRIDAVPIPEPTSFGMASSALVAALAISGYRNNRSRVQGA